MSAFSSWLRHVFSSETVLYECRNCGTTLEEDSEECPECSATEVATYQLS
jgi:rubrerythrin